MKEPIQMLLFEDPKNPNNTFAAVDGWWRDKRMRPTAKVLVTMIEELPPCEHQEINHAHGDIFQCRACGTEMVPTGFAPREVKNG